MKSFWLAIGAAVIWGVVPIIEKIGLNSKVDPAVGVVFRTLGSVIGVVILFIFLLNTDAASQLKKVDTKALWILAVSGFLASVVAQIFFYNALSGGDASVATPVAGAFPLITFVLGVLILGEAVTVQKIMGVMLIIGGVVLLK